MGPIWVPDISVERVAQRFHDHLTDEVLPITFVAFDGNTLVGGVSLRENDGIRPALRSLRPKSPLGETGVLGKR